jgi:hypothetical protein
VEWFILLRSPWAAGLAPVCAFAPGLWVDVNHQHKAGGDQDFLIDRERLIKLLGLLGSDHDGEIASAGRMADALIRDAGVTWADVIAPDAIQQELVGALRAENEELREQVYRLLVQKNELQVRARASREMFYKRLGQGQTVRGVNYCTHDCLWRILARFWTV